jgi:hypothetical protein
MEEGQENEVTITALGFDGAAKTQATPRSEIQV